MIFYQAKYMMGGEMRRVAIVLVAVIAYIGQQTGRVTGASISLTPAHFDPFLPGATFLFKCHYSSDHDAIVQMIKTEVVFRSKTSNSTTHPTDGPYILSNNTDLHEALIKTTRYLIYPYRRNEIKLMVVEAQPEDSGIWGCRLIDSATGDVIIQSSLTEVFVKGPLLGISLVSSNNSMWTHEDVLADGDTLHLHAGQSSNFYCRVNITNAMPMVSITTGSGPNAKDVLDQYDARFASITKGGQGGLVADTHIIRYMPKYSGYTPTYGDDKQVFTCEAYVYPEQVMSTHIILDVTRR